MYRENNPVVIISKWYVNFKKLVLLAANDEGIAGYNANELLAIANGDEDELFTADNFDVLTKESVELVIPILVFV